MFENRPPKVAANLRFGCRRRYAIAFTSLIETLERMIPGTMLPHEIKQVMEIKANVIARAEKERDLELRKADSTPTCSRVEAEHRTYNGK